MVAVNIETRKIGRHARMPKSVSITAGRSCTLLKAVFEFARTVFLLMASSLAFLRFALSYWSCTTCRIEQGK
jgi:hypothetical protein